jgi:hypothetical protein
MVMTTLFLMFQIAHLHPTCPIILIGIGTMNSWRVAFMVPVSGFISNQSLNSIIICNCK